MKNLYFITAVTLFILLGPVYTAFCQTPEAFTYQAEARDSRGRLLANTIIDLRATILNQTGTVTPTETIKWQGEYNVKTDKFGLFTIVIGSDFDATFTSINWGDGKFFLKIEIKSGGNWNLVSTAQLLSVPYALYAKTSATATETKAYFEKLLNDLGLLPRNYAGPVTDVEGNTYKTVLIGNQTWMAENLKTTMYRDWTPIPSVKDINGNGSSHDEWFGLTTPAFCWYNDDVANKNTYGALYNWYAVETNKLCPTGWHVPDDADWTTLVDYLGGAIVAGGKMKETGTTHWDIPNTGATNESGFTGLPGGLRNKTVDGTFYYHYMTWLGHWWSSSEVSPLSASNWYLYTFASDFFRVSDGSEKNWGLSVRCVRDN